MLCLGGFLRNQNSRQSLHANTLLRGKVAKVKNRGQRVGERGQANSKGHISELSTASQETRPVGHSCMMSGRGWENHNASEQSAWNRKDKDFICWLLPISCLSLVQVHSMGCELSCTSWFVASCWLGEARAFIGPIKSDHFSRILVDIKYGRKSTMFLPPFALLICFFNWVQSKWDSLCSLGAVVVMT